MLTKRIYCYACALFGALALCLGGARAQAADSAPLPLTVRAGYAMPADGNTDNAGVAGVEAEFVISERLRLALSYDMGFSAGCTVPTAGVTTNACDVKTQTLAVAVKSAPENHGGLYAGLGVARERRDTGLTATQGGAVYRISSKPSRIGLLALIGYAPRGSGEGPVIEARYLLAEKKQWNPLDPGGARMGGLTITAGYRILIK